MALAVGSLLLGLPQAHHVPNAIKPQASRVNAEADATI
jgi:hypothetical protein